MDNSMNFKKRKKNEYIIHDEYVEIVLTNSDKKVKIDICKMSLCQKYTWCSGVQGYVVGNTEKGKIRLNRYIIGEENIPLNMVVDHVNGDITDNRLSNLRVCTQKENCRNLKLSKNNTSGHNGISFNKKRQKWHAYIRVNYKRKHLGIYADINDAIKARKQAELEYFGFLMEDKKTIKSRDELNNTQEGQ